MRLAYIYEIFPEMLDISDQVLREKCATIWKEAFEETEWTPETLHMSPIVLENPDCPGNNLEHTRDVAALTMLSYDYMKGKYGDVIRLKRDHLLAAALLHDVGKLYEYAPGPDRVVYSPSAKYLRHPLKGALLAAKHGLPEDVIHAIGTHSFEGNQSHTTEAYYFLRCADKTAYETLHEHE